MSMGAVICDGTRARGLNWLRRRVMMTGRGTCLLEPRTGLTAICMWMLGILEHLGRRSGISRGTTFDVMIGGAPSNYTKDNLPTGNNERYFAGELSEAAFFTNALSDSQVVALFAAAGTPAGIATEPTAVIPIPVGQNGTVFRFGSGDAAVEFSMVR